MTTLVTGVAGFIGYFVARALLDRGEAVVGIDNLNDYYDVQLKRDRLSELTGHASFKFEQIDIADEPALKAVGERGKFRRVVHLAAQPGVRYSLENPHAYVRSNVVGHLNILELCRNEDGLEHLCYASSSSVYGGNTKQPFAESDRVDEPVSLYAATKKSDEMMSHVYSHLYGIPQTGLRFFTVYGPWSRPDMATWLFTEAIFAGRPIQVFNQGVMKRDFTYIDDITSGVIAVCDSPPPETAGKVRHRVYNIGNNRPEPLMKMIALLEEATGRKAVMEMTDMQPGDVAATYADISAISADHGFRPTTPLEMGIPRFVEWFKSYKGIA